MLRICSTSDARRKPLQVRQTLRLTIKLVLTNLATDFPFPYPSFRCRSTILRGFEFISLL